MWLCLFRLGWCSTPLKPAQIKKITIMSQKQTTTMFLLFFNPLLFLLFLSWLPKASISFGSQVTTYSFLFGECICANELFGLFAALFKNIFCGNFYRNMEWMLLPSWYNGSREPFCLQEWCFMVSVFCGAFWTILGAFWITFQRNMEWILSKSWLGGCRKPLYSQ